MSTPLTLDEIAKLCGTDKASSHPYTPHDYARHYDQHFTIWRNAPIKLLEIGVGGGESIHTWLNYFYKAKVFGVDIVHDTNPMNTPLAKEIDRYMFVTGDQSCETFWACFLADYGKEWDIIIDDGGHFSHQVTTSFKCLWPAVKSGGLYCIEDLGVTYGDSTVFVKPGYQNHMHFLKDQIDAMNNGSEVDSMHFSKELCIMRKK